MSSAGNIGPSGPGLKTISNIPLSKKIESNWVATGFAGALPWMDWTIRAFYAYLFID